MRWVVQTFWDIKAIIQMMRCFLDRFENPNLEAQLLVFSITGWNARAAQKNTAKWHDLPRLFETNRILKHPSRLGKICTLVLDFFGYFFREVRHGKVVGCWHLLSPTHGDDSFSCPCNRRRVQVQYNNILGVISTLQIKGPSKMARLATVGPRWFCKMAQVESEWRWMTPIVFWTKSGSSQTRLEFKV